MKISRLREKLGALWWNTLIILLAQRVIDFFNAIVGVWLVPRYVPLHELGAVRPLMQIGLLLGVPLGILITPYIKLLNLHASREEFGKVKALLRDALYFVAIVAPLTMLIAYCMMPYFLKKTNLQDGHLAMFVVFSGILGTLTPIFTEAMRALKRFQSFSIVGLIAAPFRLVVLLLAMPFRGITGYFLGQSAGHCLTILLASRDLIRHFWNQIRCEAYWHEDRKLFLIYVIPLGINSFAGNFRNTMEMLLLPSLPEMDSAAFYHLSIFSEISTYVLTPLIFVMFPLVAERHEKGESTMKTLIQTITVSLGVGGLVAIGLSCLGSTLFSLSDVRVMGRAVFEFASVWKPYCGYTKYFWILALTSGFRMALSCFTAHELACQRFRYMWYVVPLALVESILIQLATRYPSLSGFGTWKLVHVLSLMLTFAILPMVGVAIDLWKRRRTNRSTDLS